MAWIETFGVVLLAFAGLAIGKWIAKKPYWIMGFVIPFFFLLIIGLARYVSGLEFFPPVSWLMSGRREFAVIAIITTMLLATPISRSGSKRLKILVYIFLASIIIYYSVLPFLLPGIIREYLLGLTTRFDQKNICLQSNGYNCGPAAAVTALKQLGLTAEEGKLAVLAHTNPIAGTPPDSLCLAIQKHYADKGFLCKYGEFNSISELRGLEPVIALVKYSFLVDHYVTVLTVNQKTLTVGDPSIGFRKLSHKEFQKVWRYRGIILRKSKPGFTSSQTVEGSIGRIDSFIN
jgi:predicted double-glycine peptidase